MGGLQAATLVKAWQGGRPLPNDCFSPLNGYGANYRLQLLVQPGLEPSDPTSSPCPGCYGRLTEISTAKWVCGAGGRSDENGAHLAIHLFPETLTFAFLLVWNETPFSFILVFVLFSVKQTSTTFLLRKR